MENLFTSVRNMTLADSVSEADADRVRQLVESLRPQRCCDQEPGRRPLSPTLNHRPAPRHGRSPGRCKHLESRDLQQGLQSAKELMHGRLKRGAWRS